MGGGRKVEKVHAERQVGGRVLRIIEGDLTALDVDAIVNAANSHLQHGGGVAGAIVKKGGQVIQDESDRVGFTPVGTAVATSGGRLKARWVIHTVGPRWGEGEEERKLGNAIRSALRLAGEKGAKTLALPAVSAGIFGFPPDRCARVIVTAILSQFGEAPEAEPQRVDLCLLGDRLLRHFVEAINEADS